MIRYHGEQNIRISKFEKKILNLILETLNAKSTQMSLPTGRQAKHQIQNRLIQSF